MADKEITTAALIADTATRIFSDACDHDLVEAAQEGQWPTELWQTLESNGLLQLGLAESGTGLTELYTFLRIAARFAVPLPLFERLIAQVALGREAPGVALAEIHDGKLALSWPSQHDQVLALDRGLKVARLIPLKGLKDQPIESMRGEPTAAYDVEHAWDAARESQITATNLFALAALGRTAQMCGALEASLELAIGYCSEREQFGRPISKFQAIQHQLAVLAAEVAAAQRATDAAVDSLGLIGGDQGDLLRISDIAVAKVRVGAAVGVGAEIAHQVHGAMGFTMEYRLHQFTRRLWSWRDDFGTEDEWASLIGEQVCESPADELWSYIASHG